MGKAERKREAREKRDLARAARKGENRDGNSPAALPGAAGGDRSTALTAGRSTPRQDSGQGGSAGGGVPGAGALPPERVEQIRASAKRNVGEIMRDFRAQLDADPELRETLQAVYGQRLKQRKLDRTVEDAEDDLRDVQETVKRANELDEGIRTRRKISDERAIEMLEDAAEACHEVLLMVRETLRGVSPERREAAREILNEKPVSGVDGRKQPRGAPDPVVTLQKLELQASSLLKRILAKTNPNAGKKVA